MSNNLRAHHTTIEIRPSEHQIQNAIIGFLQYKGYYVQRLNAGKYAMGEGRARRFVQGVRAGTPDLMAFKTHIGAIFQNESIELLFIEVKTPKNKPTQLQLEVMKELEEHGARCIVAHSVEEVEEAIA